MNKKNLITYRMSVNYTDEQLKEYLESNAFYYGQDTTEQIKQISEYSGVIYTANPDVETADSGKPETDIPA